MCIRDRFFDIVDIGKGCAGGGPEWFAGFRSYDRPVYPELKLTQKLLCIGLDLKVMCLSLIHISEPTRLLSISYAVFCLKKKKTPHTPNHISLIQMTINIIY
eukprot:TRINITY_DN35481_c0_g1_i1.p1 TRINITY_DN35481_c0_g1~~TRINITY_DN35481_c0_g1_i1.p1  ORF type:complete len:102 (+),score=6.13 TRINITY_DN35481_c0_g1_i1:140-445(+)